MFFAIINIYNKKTKGPTVMKFSQPQENWNGFFLQPKMFDVCTTGDTAHIDTLFKLFPRTRQHVVFLDG